MTLIANNGGLLWNFLRGIAMVPAEETARRLAESPRRASIWSDPPEIEDASRAPLSPTVLASGVFVAAMIEEDAERWDGLA